MNQGISIKNHAKKLNLLVYILLETMCLLDIKVQISTNLKEDLHIITHKVIHWQYETAIANSLAIPIAVTKYILSLKYKYYNLASLS